MFYLAEFFKALGEAPVRGFFFLTLTCLLSFGLTHRSWLNSTLQKVTPEKMVAPYFVAVLDKKTDSEKIKRLINKLPGVLSIDEEESKNGQKKLQSFIKQLGSGYRISPDLLDFKSIRIMLNPTLSPESLSFVRDQVVKFGGKEHVTASEVKYPEVTSVMKAHPFYQFLGEAGDWGILGFMAFLWVLSYWTCYHVFRSRAYIIEKFQRKKFVAAKGLAMGLGSIVIVFAALALWNGTLGLVDLALLMVVFSVSWTFSMQEWRWKPTL